MFHEITEPAIGEAFAHPREIDMDLVDAQQARRVLDRLVGYNLSPLLWRKVRGRLSAGRVQSVALRLVVEREREIDAFVPVEYWSIDGRAVARRAARRPTLPSWSRWMAKSRGLGSEADVTPLLVDLEQAAYAIRKIKQGERRRKPSAALHHQHTAAGSVAASSVLPPGARWRSRSSFTKASTSAKAARWA